MDLRGIISFCRGEPRGFSEDLEDPNRPKSICGDFFSCIHPLCAEMTKGYHYLTGRCSKKNPKGEKDGTAERIASTAQGTLVSARSNQSGNAGLKTAGGAGLPSDPEEPAETDEPTETDLLLGKNKGEEWVAVQTPDPEQIRERQRKRTPDPDPGYFFVDKIDSAN